MVKLFPLHVVALALIFSQKGVHCQTTKSSECPGYGSCSSGQCDNSEICIDGQCKARCINVTASGECMECQDRLYGKQCKNECPCTCLNSRCQLGNNSHVKCTEGCEAGWKGGKCSVQCPKNCPLCERYGEKCESCSKGHYGENCQKFCPENCKGSCNIITGECTCEPGCRGRQCTIKCPEDCGSDCDLSKCECQVGYSGDECEEMCPQNCEAGCDRVTGQCFKCKSGYRGGNCSETCPPNCEEGCNRETGECSICKSGFKGGYCSEMCPKECSNCDPNDWFCTGCFALGECVALNESKWGPPVTIAVGTTLLSLFVILLIIVIIIGHVSRRKKKKRQFELIKLNELKRKRRNTTRSRECYGEWNTENPVYEPFRTTEEISLPRIKLCPELKSQNSEHHMKQEFKVLPLPVVQSSHCGCLPENLSKNRYRDILPFDGSRVCLAVEDEGDSDYINASYIDGYKQKTQYIAAQGPTEEVVDDFWRMIWQCEVGNIVMLTNLVEGDNEERCDMYWPFCGINYKTYGDISVQCVEERVFEDHIVRSLSVWKSNHWTRLMKQFHYIAWPAQGVPAVESMINFYKVVRESSVGEDGATLVHCSAGVGRTGTYLALVYLIEQATFEGRACVYSCVSDLRFQRMKLVHTEEQYIFLYHIVTAALQTKGILPGSTVPCWLQCKVCWETDKRHPVVNGVRIVYNPLDTNATHCSMDRLL